MQTTISDAADPIAAGIVMLVALAALMVVIWICLRNADSSKPIDDYDIFFPEDWT